MATHNVLQYRLTFTRSRTHPHTSDGGVSRAGRQPARREQSGRGRHLDTHTHTQLGGAGDQTSDPSGLPANPLYRLMHTPSSVPNTTGSARPLSHGAEERQQLSADDWLALHHREEAYLMAAPDSPSAAAAAPGSSSSGGPIGEQTI